MHVIQVEDVNFALLEGIQLIQDYGVNISPRGLSTIEVPSPVVTVYEKPLQRCLFLPTRDANPFFLAMEALWILAGRQDVEFLTRFNKRMADFSDNGVTFHAPYGYRLRHGADAFKVKDQFKEIIKLFKQDIDTRRGVLQIWDSLYDLNYPTKDTFCNDMMFFKVRNGKLNMTVCNRSNDMIWGAYGANIVQFSTIQEYLAAMIGVGVGEYRQVSDSFHVYPDNPQWHKLKDWAESNNYSPWAVVSYSELGVRPFPLVSDPGSFDTELRLWFVDPTNASGHEYKNRYFSSVATPMYKCWDDHKASRDGLSSVHNILAEDWQYACTMWLGRRELV